MNTTENRETAKSIRSRATLKALGSYFEIACIMSLVVIAADMTWLLHDILINGLSITYTIIGTGMLIGFIGTLYVTIAHNRSVSGKHCHRLLQSKLDIIKRRHVRAAKEARIAKAKAKGV